MGLAEVKPLSAIQERRIPRPEGIEPPGVLRGVDIAERIMSRAESGKILVYFDPDWDGLVAGLLLCKVLSKNRKQFSWYVNTNRAHGFKLDIDDMRRLTGKHDVSGWTVVNGDFSVSREKVQELVNAGVSIVSLDHHEVDEKELIHEVGKDGAEGIVCNNQYWFEDQTNLYQSGAGVTFEVLREFEPWLDNLENRALVGITLLTDIRDLDNPRAMQYLHDLYHHPYQDYIKYLIKNTMGKVDYNFGLPKLDRNFVDFKLGPKLNSIFRFNQEDVAVRFILGQGYPDNVNYQKSQQDFLKELEKKSIVKKFKHLTVVEVHAEDYTPHQRGYISNFVGILAGKFVGAGRSCVAYCLDSTGALERASFRGYVQTAPYRERLQEVFNGQGHSGAFGIPGLVIKPGMWERANEICGEAEAGTKVQELYATVRNLDTFMRSEGSIVGDLNQYRKGPDKIYLKYTGTRVTTVREGERFAIYEIDGHQVKCFNRSLDPLKDLILPIYDRSGIGFFLEREFREEVAVRISLDV